MAKYTLGIDTTFHASGVGIVDDAGRVVFNKKLDIDFTNEEANRFYNFHNRSTLSLIGPVLDEYSDDISLISVSCLEGPFHSMPVGAVVANTLSCLLDKPIIGVKHEDAHLHSVWLDRDEHEFSFPIVSLSISGARSNIFLLRSICQIEKIAGVAWQSGREKVGGLGNLCDVVCRFMNIEIKRGEGGQLLERLAKTGELKYIQSLNHLAAKREGNDVYFGDIRSDIPKILEGLGYQSFDKEVLEKFRCDFASSLFHVLFRSLAETMVQIVSELGAKEFHFVGGVAANELLSFEFKNYCEKKGLVFRIPAKPQYCGDNGAMVAVSGYLQRKHAIISLDKDEKYLNIHTSKDYYRYYAKYYG